MVGKYLVVLALFLTVASATSLVGIPLNTPITQYAILSGDQVTIPTGSIAHGAAILSYDAAAGTLQYEVVHTVESPTIAHIHGPAYPAYDNAPLIIFETAVSPIVGIANISSTLAGYLTSGQLYVNIHSTDFGNGEIRGQVVQQGQVSVGFAGANSSVSSIGHAFVTYNSAAGTITYNVTHTITNPTAAHFHGPANYTQTASPILFLANSTQQAASPIIGTQAVSTQEATYFTSDLNYINLHSVDYPVGELRGQVFFPNVQYAIPLDGTQNSGVDSDNLGIAIVSIANDNSQLDVLVISTIPVVTGCHIHGPAAIGSTASPLVFLNPEQVSLQSNVPFTTTNWTTYLSTGMMYVNVHTDAYPNGEIRGQLIALAKSGTSTSTTGSATTSHTSGATTIASFSLALFIIISLI